MYIKRTMAMGVSAYSTRPRGKNELNFSNKPLESKRNGHTSNLSEISVETVHESAELKSSRVQQG